MATWERRVDRLMRGTPYVLLVLATAASLARQGQPAQARLVTAGLAVTAGLWVWVMVSRGGPIRWPQPSVRHAGRRVLYVGGLVALAGLMMAHDALFLLFAVTGFLHAPVLLPPALAFVAVGATSVLINTVPFGFPDPSLESTTILLAVVALQTVLIGSSGIFGAKLSEQSEQRRRTVAKLEDALRENAALHARLLTQARDAGIAEERRRMAREIHDTLAQGLTGILTQVQAAGRADDRPEDRRRHLDNAARLARESLGEARRSVHAMGPQALETANLPEALGSVASRWSEVYGVAAEVTTTGTPRPLHPDVEVALLRTGQEALANVAKHAGASRVVLTLSYMGDVVTLDVRDDGVGFDTTLVDTTLQGSRGAGPGGAGDARDGGFGLPAMRQRVRQLAGTLEVESEPGAGTAVSATVPAIMAGADR